MKKTKTIKKKAETLLEKYYDYCDLTNEGPIAKKGSLVVYNDGYNVMVLDSKGNIITKRKLSY